MSQEEVRQRCPRCGSTDSQSFDGLQTVADEKFAVAQELAKKHYQAEPGLQKVFRLNGAADDERRPIEPIKLLEVNVNTVPPGILPVQFGPAPASGIPYSSVIVEVSPDEFNRIESQELMLPHGWSIAEEMPKPAISGESCSFHFNSCGSALGQHS